MPASNDIENSTGDAIYERFPLLMHGETTSIRLITVLPKPSGQIDHNATISCTIFVAASLEARPYTCLSYAWSPPTPTGETEETPQHYLIMLEGKAFAVGWNLYYFLKNARDLYPNRYFWIDAMCINQSNTAESNYSVQRMGDIYANAKEVIAWLGQDTKVAQELARSQERLNWHIWPKSLGDIWIPAVETNTYWTRAWITQEVILAQRLTLLSCESSLDWDYFRSMHTTTTEPHEPGAPPRISGHFEQTVAFAHLRRPKGLLLNLHLFGSKGCARIHDRVYSLLAICDSGNEIEVDYSISRWHLALQVWRTDPNSLCLCSFRRVAQLLQLKSSQDSEEQGRCPWKELAVDIVVVYTPAMDASVSSPALPATQLDSDPRTITSHYFLEQRHRERIKEAHRAEIDHIKSLKRSTHAICLSDVCEQFTHHLNLYQGPSGTGKHQKGQLERCGKKGGQGFELGNVEMGLPDGINVVRAPETGCLIWSFTFDALLEVVFHGREGEHTGLCSNVLRPLSAGNGGAFGGRIELRPLSKPGKPSRRGLFDELNE